ncbi:hypothetical protein [Halomonas denitrificans]|uniref:hypothetical protein n=1 Tax=Halomonas denitrificans TaxID=370769 RepID=UPI001300451F|nr:hypothetical protein [Halomonas denitrificans]
MALILKKSTIIYCLALVWVFIDILGGVFREYLGFPKFTLIVRGVFFLVLLWFCFRQAKLNKSSILILVLSCFLVSLSSVHLAFYDNYDSFLISTKLLLPLLWFSAINRLMDLELISYSLLKNVVMVGAAALLANQFLYFFDIGFSNYGVEKEALLGGTGFIFAGNEVGVTLIALFSLYLYFFSGKLLFFLGGITAFFAASIALMSKTAIFGVFLVLFIYFIFKMKRVYAYIVILVCFPFALFFSSFIASFLGPSISRWSYFYNEYGVIYFLGGVKRWKAIEAWFVDISSDPVKLLLGEGWTGLPENNFFDLVQGFGLLGFSIYLFYMVYVLINFRINSPDSRYFFCVIILIFVISFFAGHVVQSALFSLYFGLIANLYVRSSRQDVKLNNDFKCSGA